MSKKAKVAVASKGRASDQRAVSKSKLVMTYRGVRLAPLTGRSRFSKDEIERAVDAAIKKNPDAFVSKS